MTNTESGTGETNDYIRGGTQKSSYTTEEVTHWNCPLCGSSSETLIKTERQVLNVVACTQCQLIRVNPRLNHPDEVYRGKSDIYREEFRLVVENKRPHHRDPNYLHDLKLIEAHKPNGNFLDIGTNTGCFLRLARNRGWNLLGVEPSPQLGALAREWWGLEIVEGFIETLDLPERHFDIVTMTDVFEHVVNPKEVLAAVRRVIKPDGILFIKVPNAKFNMLKFRLRSALGKKGADDFDSYEHVCHYTEATLRKMLDSCGFAASKISVEEPVQIPVWHRHVGHYYQHKSPWVLDWKTYSTREVLYQMARLERIVTGRVGWLAPNIGCFARVK